MKFTERMKINIFGYISGEYCNVDTTSMTLSLSLCQIYICG